MVDRNESGLAKLAHFSQIAQLLLTVGFVGALAVGLEALLGIVLALSPVERAILGGCAFLVILGLVLAAVNLVRKRRVSEKASAESSRIYIKRWQDLEQEKEEYKAKLQNAEQECDELRQENEKLKRIQDDRLRSQIKSWRDCFDSFNYAAGNIRETAAYFAIRPHLKREVVDRLESPRPLLVSTAKTLLLDEVARLEQEWKSGSPSSQPTPSDTDAELKRQCIQLAEELTKFLDAWESYRDQPKIYPEQPEDWPRYTMKEYRKNYERRLAALLDNLGHHGLLTTEARAHFEVPADDPQTIRKVVARLSSICQRD